MPLTEIIYSLTTLCVPQAHSICYYLGAYWRYKVTPTLETWNPNLHFDNMLRIVLHAQGQDAFICSWRLMSGPSPLTVLPTQQKGS